jgi:hypothetical protein
MVKALILCQRRATSGDQKRMVKIATESIERVICELLEITPDELDTLYVRDVVNNNVDIVDLPYTLEFVGKEDQDRAVAAFIEEHRKSFDVVFLNTCPLGFLVESIPLIKELLKDNGKLFVGAFSESYGKPAFGNAIAVNSLDIGFHYIIVKTTESINDAGQPVLNKFQEEPPIVPYKMRVFTLVEVGSGVRRRRPSRKTKRRSISRRNRSRKNKKSFRRHK